MGNLGTIKQKTLIKYMESKGFVKHRQIGSHAVYWNHKLNARLTIVVGRKDVQVYLIKEVIKALNITRQDFEKEIK